MRVTIHQPQFLPWLGYLDKIDQADLFVVLDSVQFKKNEWQNRNRIRTAQGWQWLTVPVRHRFGQRIHEVRINESTDWRSRQLRALEMNYSRAPFRKEFLQEFGEMLHQETGSLASLNLGTVRWLLDKFGITTPIKLASTIQAREEPTERLIDICESVGATAYLAGPGAEAYMDMKKFRSTGIEVDIQVFQHPDYSQCYEPFVPTLSAIDLLLNIGKEGLNRVRENRKASNPSVQACLH